MSTPDQQVSRQRRTEQERARLAWSTISEVRKQKTEVKKKYHTLARQLGALTHANGLTQTLAFLMAKAAEKNDQQTGTEARAADLLLTCLRESLTPLIGKEAAATKKSLMDHLLQAPSYVHRRATVEVLAFARWLSRFAEAELPSEERTAQDNDGQAAEAAAAAPEGGDGQ
jgi:CRISPR-associated protein Cmr5